MFATNPLSPMPDEPPKSHIAPKRLPPISKLLDDYASHPLPSKSSLMMINSAKSNKTYDRGWLIWFCHKFHMISGGEVVLASWKMPQLSSVQRRKWYGSQQIRKALFCISMECYFELVFVGFKPKDMEFLSLTWAWLYGTANTWDWQCNVKDKPISFLFVWKGEEEEEKSQEWAPSFRQPWSRQPV